MGLWLVRALVVSLSLMHAGDFQHRLLLLLLLQNECHQERFEQLDLASAVFCKYQSAIHILRQNILNRHSKYPRKERRYRKHYRLRLGMDVVLCPAPPNGCRDTQHPGE